MTRIATSLAATRMATSLAATALLASTVVLTSCTTPVKRLSGPVDRALLFPPGTYHHGVTIEPPDGKTHRFRGIVRMKENGVTVVGLSGMDATVFKIVDEKGKVAVEVFHEPMKKYESRISDFYGVLRSLLHLRTREANERGVKVTRRDARGYPTEVAVEGSEKADIFLSDYDENGVPGHMEIVLPKLRVLVKMEGYEA